jgi:hypothetical protein
MEEDVDHFGNHEFVQRLTVAHSSRSPGLASARRWRPGDVDDDLVALVGATPPGQYPSFAMTAKLFAIWHCGRSSKPQGYTVNGIGRWVRQLGVKDPKARRLIDRIIAADTEDDLTSALAALAATRTRHPPQWEKVLAELLRWADPAARTDIRFAWARDFHRYVPPRAHSTLAPEMSRTQETT